MSNTSKADPGATRNSFARDFRALSEVQAAAQHYAGDYGWPVFPVNPEDKRPRISEWPTKATTDHRQIIAWWRKWPDAAIGVVTGQRSGFVVVDVDGKPGAASLRLLKQTHGALPATRHARTPRGGRHIYFADPGGLRNSAAALGPGIDVRADGGYVVAPPSRGPAARSYRWAEEWADPAPLPRGWVLACQPAGLHQYGAAGDGATRRIRTAPADYAQAVLEDELVGLRELRGTVGQRNDQLNATAFTLGRFVAGGYLEEDAVRDALSRVGHAIGLGSEEIEKTTTSGLKGGRENPIKLVQFGGEAVKDEEFWTARPLLADLRQFARARQVAPWAVFGAVAARTIAAVSPDVVLPPTVGGHGSLNLFVALVAPSGIGKGGAEQAAKEFIDIDPGVYTASIGSGEGLLKVFAHRTRKEQINVRNSVLCTVPEIDTLTALTARSGATLLPELRKAWIGEQLGFEYSDPTKTIRIERHRCRLTLILGVQPDQAEPLLRSAGGGTPQRFLWLPARDPEMPDVPPEEPVRWSLYVEPGVRGWRKDLDTPITPEELEVVALAPSIASELREDHLARHRNPDKFDPLESHAGLARLKVAAALMILDQRHDKITEEDWALAGIVMTVSNRTRAEVQTAIGKKAHRENVARGSAEGTRAVAADTVREEAAMKRVMENLLRHLAKCGPLTRRNLSKKIHLRDRGYFAAALEKLEAAGAVARSDGQLAITALGRLSIREAERGR